MLSVKSDFQMPDGLSIAVYAFASNVLMSVSVDDTSMWTRQLVSENYHLVWKCRLFD